MKRAEYVCDSERRGSEQQRLRQAVLRGNEAEVTKAGVVR